MLRIVVGNGLRAVPSAQRPLTNRNARLNGTMFVGTLPFNRARMVSRMWNGTQAVPYDVIRACTDLFCVIPLTISPNPFFQGRKWLFYS